MIGFCNARAMACALFNRNSSYFAEPLAAFRGCLPRAFAVFSEDLTTASTSG